MARNTTQLIPFQYYHIYNRAIAGHDLFKEDRNYRYFLSRIQTYLLESSDLLAYCLMPNHYHMILKVINDRLSAAMHKLALSYVVSFNKVYGHKGHLFQGTFQRKHITDFTYLLQLSRYIHLNPVKANLVEQAEEWDYSSYLEYIGKRNSDYINTQTILDLISERPQDDLTAKHKAYQGFIELWDFNYMEFKMRN